MSHRDPPPKPSRPQLRYGIAEWYGISFPKLTVEKRKLFAHIQTQPKDLRAVQTCPFQSQMRGASVACGKEGGVCSIRIYEKTSVLGDAKPLEGSIAQVSTPCPQRFDEAGTIYQWVGKVMLGCENPLHPGQIGFLDRLPSKSKVLREVGRIDNVLVVPGSQPLSWCAMEIQSVYFSGRAMQNDFKAIAKHEGHGLPFPTVSRRPDYRSSGPKRLMPQLQIKVPSLRRWGKKMAVVVDEAFFRSMGTMKSVEHISNCDVAWFVLKYAESENKFQLVPDEVHLTTLEDSVIGLTAGVPVSLQVFEQRIIAKINRTARPV